MAVVADVAGRGGAEIGGSAGVAFTHGSQAATSDIVAEWDVDNDGDFSEPEEDITGFLVSAETTTGRDFPSQLTGKASPGTLKALLRNDDDRFSIFNANSPLETDGRSLDSGRKLRIRATEAANPDPELLAVDRFRQNDGPLVGRTTESGQTWETVTGHTDFAVEDHLARATVLGDVHLNTFDVGVADYFIQAQIGRIPIGSQTPDTAVGIVFRFVDEDNYSVLQIRANAEGAAALDHVDVVAGVPSSTVIFGVATFDGRVIGLNVKDTTADIFLEGVDLATQVTALNTTATTVGIYGDWRLHVPPEINVLRVWDRRTARTDGIVWTGDVADVVAQAQLGPDKTAELTGSGTLARLSTQKIQFPGRPTAFRLSAGIGKVLSDTGQLNPPGKITETERGGRFGLEEADAIEVARRIEETEFGFLHETQEGWIDFDARGERIGRTPAAVFSDRPGDQFAYHDIRPLSWRREIFNQVDATVAPTVPALVIGIGHQATFPGVEFNLGSVKASIQPGDLLLGWAIAGGLANLDWHGKAGWEQLTAGKAQQIGGADGDNARMFARRADGTEDDMDDFVAVASASADVEFITDLVVIRDWLGDIRQGIALGDESSGSKPPALNIEWFPDPALIFVLRTGMLGNADVSGWTEQGFDRYIFGRQTLRQVTSGAHMCMQRAHKRVAAHPVEDPAAFDGVFSGFTFTGTRTFAVRGFTGDPPGENTVRVEDLDSQDRHNAVKSYVNPGDLFLDETDATAYGQAVLARFGRRRPLVEISWWAHKGAAYRGQALRRRVGDMIFLRATGPTGLGIAGRFFIENIRNKFDKGQTFWEVTWTLSPA